MAISAAELLSLTERQYIDVPLPELGDGKTARIQSLTEKETSEYEYAMYHQKTGAPVKERLIEARRRLLCMTLVDDQGNRIFGDGDGDKLKPLNGKPLKRLFDVAHVHCGFSKGDIAELVGNFAGVRDDNSQSSSQENSAA